MVRWAFLLLLLTAPGQACDCPPRLLHLCRCKVLIETPLAQKQFDYLQWALTRRFGQRLALKTPVTVEAIHPEELTTLGGEPLQGLYDNGKIWISNGLLREQAMVVLAHEYGHAWHFENHPDPDAIVPILAEGFAEWLAYHGLARVGFSDACDRIRKSPDPIYGGGFRYFQELEEIYGVEAVFNLATSWIDLDGNRAK